MSRTSRYSPLGRRMLACALSATLAAVAGSGGWALAAGSPGEAVETLVDRIETGGFDDLTGVVCPELEDEIRAEFDPSASGGTFGAVQVDIADPVVTIVSEDAGSAVVNLSGTMHITFDETQVRDFVRAQLEATGQDTSDEAVEAMLGLMTSFASEDLPIDEDLTVTERDGEWLVCDTGESEDSFTDSGMCGLVTPEEIGALSPIAIVSNVGEGDYCQWVGADDDSYLSIDLALIRDASLDDYRAADPGAQELMVGTQPAIGSSGQLYVTVDAGVLSVLPYLTDGPDPDADPIAFAVAFAELFVPRLDRLTAPAPVPDDIGTAPLGDGPLADCAVIDLGALNALSPLQYDTVSGDGGFCSITSSDFSAGAPFLGISLDPFSTIDDLSTIFPDGTAGDLGGHRSYAAIDTLWVQLDDGLLSVTPFFAASPDAGDLDPYAYAADVAALVIEIIATQG